jgi:hypothetical protein
MRSFKISSLLVLTVSAATACNHPYSMPSGYTYHGDVYKSATPAPSKKFTPEQRATMGPEQADQFRLSVYQLAEALTLRAGLPPKSVFVARPEKMTAFYAQMDNDVRESLRHLGYQLADTPADAYIITYTAQTLTEPKSPAPASAIPAGANVRLGLQVFDGIGEAPVMLTEESDNFYIRGAETLSLNAPLFAGIDLTQTSARLGNNQE